MKDRRLVGFERIIIVVSLSFMLLGLASVLLGWQVRPVRAAIIIVNRATGSDTATCGSVGEPCYSIAYAVANRAGSEDVVSVQSGTYTETIVMAAGVVIEGAGVSTTFIDGEGMRGPMVTAGSGVTESAVLRGITIRNGSSTTDGGGMSITGGASPIVDNCVITNSQAVGRGGGIYVSASSPIISVTQVLSNTAVRGGGMYVASDAFPVLDGVTMSYNRASGTAFGDGGGGLYVVDSLTVTDTLVVSNTASVRGGGIYQFDESGWLNLIGGRLERNVAAAEHGGGVFVRGNLLLTGTLVLSNTAALWGGGMSVEHDVIMTDVHVLDNMAGLWGGGLYQNRLFVDHVSISGGRFENNLLTSPTSIGGALFSSSPLTIIGTEVISNAANEGGGIHGSSVMTVTNAQILSNTAATNGGGLELNYLGGSNEGRWAHIVNTRFENNKARSGDGGAIRSMGNVALTQTQVIHNGAVGTGGGVYVQYNMALSDTHILSNTSGGRGGGVYQIGSGGWMEGIGGQIAYNTSVNSGGGGLYTRSTLTLSGTRVLSNTCFQWGGGVYLDGASASANWSDVELIGNRAQNGGGLYIANTNAQATVIGGVWQGNIATGTYGWQGGGGAYANGLLVLSGTRVIGNLVGGSGRGGGGVFVDGGLESINSLFASNTASSGDGAAVYIGGTSGAYTLLHTTVASATIGSPSAVYVYTGTVNITNTIVASYTVGLRRDSGTVSEDYNLYFGNGTAIQGIVQSGGHSLFGLDPRFIDPAGGNYHIDDESVALDTGSFDPGITTDVDSDPRPINTAQPDAPDIGCDENRDTTVRRTIEDTLTFGAVCARQVFTDTGTLTTVTASLAYEYPPDMSGAAISRTYTITSTGIGPVSATMTLCYTDDEIAVANVDENLLTLYRYDGSSWYPYSSTVDMVGNTVTAVGIDAFSMWALAESTPNAVDLYSFVARPTPHGIVLDWETALEIDTLGFNLYRFDGVTEVRLNDSIILSQAPGSVVGARYQWLDISAQPGVEYIYWLEDVDVRGRFTRHGPASCQLPNTVFRLIYLPYTPVENR